jgi:NAD(P)H dehydrogenase (quinone)
VNILIIVAHPHRQSFNRAIADTVVRSVREMGHVPIFHDLYEEEFDPILRNEEIPKGAKIAPIVESYCTELAAADGIVIVHPNWWGSPPAILKGWVDRVFRPGVAYEFYDGDGGEGVPVGLLKAKTAVVFNTANTPGPREKQVFGDPLETFWKNCIFGLCGVTGFRRRTFEVVVTSSPAQRKEWLKEVDRIVQAYFLREQRNCR